MYEGKVFEVEGVNYAAMIQPAHLLNEDMCAGCVAHTDEELCEKMPRCYSLSMCNYVFVPMVQQ